ncbi:MAG: hypothetical protein CSA64_00910 [Arachnia propionica]|nr:MAG: hypothetical protein CSA64_00910 [Arachnia propionica]
MASIGRPRGDAANGKERLLQAGWDLLLNSDSADRITIAAVCEKANCTAPTLYHHFGDLNQLLLVAGYRAWTTWSKEINDECDEIEDPKGRLIRRGISYVSWAKQNPKAYRALFLERRFSSNSASIVDMPGISELAADVAAVHDLDQNDPDFSTWLLGYWGLAHGVAALALSRPELAQQAAEAAIATMGNALQHCRD